MKLDSSRSSGSEVETVASDLRKIFVITRLKMGSVAGISNAFWPTVSHLRWRLVAYALAYVVGGYLGQWPPLAPNQIAMLCIPSGLTLAVLLMSDRKYWSQIATVGLVTDFALQHWLYDFRPIAAAVVATGNILEPLAGASLVLWRCGHPFRFEGLRDVLSLTLLAAVISPVISATTAAATLHVTGAHGFMSAWFLWWLSDAIGVLIVAPLVIAILQVKREALRLNTVLLAEGAALFLVLVTVVHLWLTGRVPITFIILPFLLWAALRFGVTGAALALATLAAMTFGYIEAGFAPFGDRVFSPYERTVLVQGFLGIASVSTLLLAALNEQVIAALAELKRLNEGLENRVAMKRRALQASELRARELMDNQLAFIGQLSTDGTLIDVNRAALTAAGVSSTDVIGRKFWDCYWGSYDNAAQSRLQEAVRAAAAGKVVRYDETFRTAGDSRIIVDFMVVPIRAASGKISYLIPSGVDITDRKKAEIDLVEKEERLKLALEGAGAVDWSWDISSNRLTRSDRYREFFGDAAEPPLVYEDAIDRVHAEDRARLQRRVDQMLTAPGDDIWREEFRMVVPNRGVVWLGSFGLMKRDESGLPQRMTGIFVDVTQRRQAEFQLRLHQESQAKLARLGALGEYSAGIAHEINQPLMAARVYLRLAGDAIVNAEAKDEVVGAVANATAQIDRAGNVIRRLREFIQFGTVDPTPADLLGIARSSVRLLQPEIEQAEIVVREEFSVDSDVVLVDPLQIELVLTNLLRNSIEAISTAGIKDGRITIKASDVDRDWVEVTVQDTGPGFSSDNPPVPALLATTKNDGLGLGLSLSKSIIEAHGGKFWMGHCPSGAAVHFTLPKTKEIAPCRSPLELH